MRKIRYTLSRLGLALIVSILPLTALAQTAELQFYRPHDQQGLNVFEPPKADTVAFNGLTVDWGAAFTQQFQALDHSNDTPADDLPEIGAGFNLATANLYLGAQLADGIRVNLTTYLSSRHHPEAWVKGGYLQADKLPMFNSAALDNVMEYVTVKVGHFEINYGDTHFRRSDNGNALYNPFVGNYILDAFTTEVGGEVYVRSNSFLAMGGITGGELDPTVTNPDQRAPSFYGKLGVDRQVTPDLRLRLTGSAYTTKKSIANHLHSGDRAGSRYYDVMEGGAWSGRIRSSFGNQVTAFMINPFVKFHGLELFGTIEQVTGSRAGLDDGNLDQYAAEAIYRFANEDLYVGARYNTVKGDLDLSARGEPANWVEGISADRWQFSAGWFITPNALVKAAYVQQTYNDYPPTTIFYGGEFDGLMMEAVLSF